jgi:hypothetical protein
MELDLETFDKQFDAGLNSVKSLGGREKGLTIINLCQKPNKPTEKRPNTLGKAAIVPILDKGMHPIHKVAGVISTTVQVENPDFNPDDPDSPEFYWRTYTAIPVDSYSCPLTDQEKDLVNELYGLSQDYGATFSQYGAKVQDLFFMKAYMIKLNSAVSGALFTNLEEPVILQHSSRRFPKAYTDMCNTNDEWGHEWRKQLFIPDGLVKNFAVCSTVKEDVGYQVKFEYQSNIDTGRNIDLAKLKEWMNFDINTIGVDTTFCDVERIKEAIANINKAWDRAEGKATESLDSGIQSPTQAAPAAQAQPTAQPAANVSTDGVLTL